MSPRTGTKRNFSKIISEVVSVFKVRIIKQMDRSHLLLTKSLCLCELWRGSLSMTTKGAESFLDDVLGVLGIGLISTLLVRLHAVIQPDGASGIAFSKLLVLKLNLFSESLLASVVLSDRALVEPPIAFVAVIRLGEREKWLVLVLIHMVHLIGLKY